MMWKPLMILVLVLVSLLAGCTQVETSAQRKQRIGHIWELQTRMIVEDFDAMFLLDRNTRLSKWNTDVGY